MRNAVSLCIVAVCTLLISVGQNRTAAQSGLPESVVLHGDIPYALTDDLRQTLDVIVPAERKPARLPVIAFIHGGAWRAGDKAGGRQRIAALIASGDYAGVSIAYRLSGEAKWPAQIHDCKAAIRWIRANADRYRLDPDRIAVWGTSAGGHLVAMLGTSGDVGSLEGRLGGHLEESSRVQCVVDFYGPSELLAMNQFPSRIDHEAPNSPESQLIGGAIRDHAEAARAASPITYVTRDDPPFLIVHGTDDMAVPYDQSVRLHEALQNAGVTSSLLTVKNGGHGGFNNPQVNQFVRLFLDRNLLNGETDISSAELPAGEN